MVGRRGGGCWLILDHSEGFENRIAVVELLLAAIAGLEGIGLRFQPPP